MKLIELKCPRCNATLKVNPELDKCYCLYCGNELLIDDEQQEVKITGGYEFGYGNQYGKMQAAYDFNQTHQTEMQRQYEHQLDEQKRTIRNACIKRAWYQATTIGLVGFFVALLYFSKFITGLFVGGVSVALGFLICYKIQAKLYLDKVGGKGQ